MTEQATANRIWYRDFNMMALEKILKIIIIFGIRILTASQVENVGEDFSAAERVQSMRVYLHNGTFRTFDELQQLKNSLVFDENHNSKDRYYELKSKNKTFVFHVFPDFELISSRFHIEHVFNDSTSLKFQRKNLRNCHFSGKIVYDENSAVVLDTCYNLRGAFKTSHGSFVIEPVSQLVNNNKEITEQTLKRMPRNGYSSYNPGSCAVKDSEIPVKKPNHEYTFSLSQNGAFDLVEVKSRKRRSFVRRRYIEAMIVADESMYKAFGEQEIELRSYLLSMMAIVRRIFQDASLGHSVEVSVVKMMILKKTQADLKIPQRGEDSAEVALKNFCKWQRKHNSPNDKSSKHFDTAILITKRDICSKQRGCDTLGLAELGVICDQKRSCAVIQDNGIAAAFTIAHELGHLFNMAHDGIHNDCSPENRGLHIMTPSFSLSAHTWSFSKCSRKYITDFLESGGGNCLFDKPSPKVEHNLPTKMAGEMFNHDEQCQLVFGKRYEACSIIKTDCTKLYCQRKGGMVNSNGHPTCSTNNLAPAEGTICDKKKWCVQGKCIPRKKLKIVDGGWGAWSPFGACSRTCGGGIMRSQRECENPRPLHGGAYCIGVRNRHRSCHVRPCPAGTRSFRAEQCARFNGKDLGINGISPSVRWIPKHEGVRVEDSCRLFCQIENYHVYYELASKVIDGTPCRKGSFDVCVEGKCRPAGCDRVLNSAAKMDICDVCNGDNSTCKAIHRRVRITTIGYYNFVFRVPRGARNFKVIQRSPTNMPDTIALALLDYRMRYIFNGNYVIGLGKKTFISNGQEVYYSGLNVVNETIWIPGRLKSPFVVHALAVGERMPVNVEVSYNLPSRDKETYIWMLKDNWNECSHVCQGKQYREYLCLRESDSQRVADGKCGKKRPLSEVQKCNRHCTLSWKIKVEVECTARCGDGFKLQSAYCIKQYGNATEDIEITDNKHCHEIKKPPSKVTCHVSCTETRWNYSSWGKCSKSCGGGVQSRKASCVDYLLKKLPDKQCNITKRGPLKRSCNEIGCPQWETSEWSMCSVTCGKGNQDRSVFCVDGHGIKQVGPKYCNETQKPDIVRPCILRACPAWQVGAWSGCSVSCGVGYQTRKIACRRADGEHVSERECNAPSRPVDRQVCKTRPCPADVHAAIDAATSNEEAIWMTGAWTTCSVSCGTGIKQRYVSCRYRGGEVAPGNSCDAKTEPQTVERCRVRRCPEWKVGAWSQCSTSCGGGIQTRVLECKAGNHQIASHYCDKAKQPKEKHVCNQKPCVGLTSTPAQTSSSPKAAHRRIVETRGVWKMGQWSKCSVSCGSGIKQRKVKCESSTGVQCEESSKPRVTTECNDMPCPFWNYGQWSMCSVSCGPGLQRRLVVCQFNNGTYLHEESCDSKFKPNTQQICERQKCPEVARWTTSQWQPCTVTCGRGFQYRDIGCENGKGERLPKNKCSKNDRPTQQKPCELEECPRWLHDDWSECNDNCQKTRRIFCTKGEDILDMSSCGVEGRPAEIADCPSENCISSPEYSWDVGAWGPCSKTCDYSVRIRSVHCIDDTGKEVSDRYCSKSRTPRKQQACFGGPCPAKWIAQPWSECSVSCGTGLQERHVVCEGMLEKRLEPVSCNAENRPSVTRACNMGKCHESYRWKTGNWSKCTRDCNVGASIRDVYCVDLAGKRASDVRCVAKRPPSFRVCNTHSCPPTSCYAVQQQLDVFIDGEHMLMTKDKKYLKVYCEGMSTNRPREYISLKTPTTENYSEIYGKRLRNRKTCPQNNGTRIKHCPNCLDFSSSGTTYFSKIRIDFKRLVLIPEDTKFAIKFGRYPPPLASAGDCFSQAYCPQGSFKLNLNNTGITLEPSVTWKTRGYHVSQKINKSSDGRVVEGRCGGYCGMCSPSQLKVRCVNS